MLTHHLSDANGELLVFKSGAASFTGKSSNYKLGFDPDGSYSSERYKQSKLEKLEMEITRLLEKNDGKLFIIRQEKNSFCKEDGNCDDYSQEWSSMDIKTRQIFRVRYRPRTSCALHKAILNKDELER
jgi:hypothetical protein